MQQNKHETPAQGIMRTGSWPDADVFRVACDCQATEHDINVWVECQGDADTREVTVTFYVDTEIPFWEKGFSRLRTAWRVLCSGRYESSRSVILNHQAAANFAAAISASIQRLQKSVEKS